MMYLKQSTAVTLKIGPFVDSTDGSTAETGLTIAQADVRLSKNGNNINPKAETTTCTHDEIGVYRCLINTVDTGTLGRLQLWVNESGALPVWHEYMVVTANTYNSMCGTDYYYADIIQLGGNGTSLQDLKDFADSGYDPVAHLTRSSLYAMGGSIQSATDLRDFADAGYDPVNNKVYADMKAINGTVQSATDLKDFADAGYNPASHRVYSDLRMLAGNQQSLTDLRDFADQGYNPATNYITGVTTCTTTTTNTDMRGTDSAALATGVDVTSIHGSVLTETVGGYLAAGFTKLFDVATPVLVASDAMRGTDGANTTVPDAAGVAPTAVEIKAEAVAALADIKLDHLLNIAVDTNWATTVHLDSVIGHIADVGTAATFSRTTDALEAIRNQGDAGWMTATGFNTVIPDIAGTAEGLHNTMMNAVSTVDGNVDSILIDTGTTLPARFAGIEGATFNTATDSNEAIRNRGDGEWVTATTTALNAQGKLDVNAECDTALSDYGANTVVPDIAGTAATLHSATDGLVTTVDTVVDTILVDTNDLQTNQGDWLTATSVTVSDKTGFSLSNAGVDAILDEIIEGTHTLRQYMRTFASVLIGKVSGGGTDTIVYRDVDDSKDRVTATVTGVGDRTTVTLTED